MSAYEDVMAIIDLHLGGEAITARMQADMEQSLQRAAWILAWRKKDKRVYYDCCGKTLRDEAEINEAGGVDVLHLHHRDAGHCPFCGKPVKVLTVYHTGYKDITETYQTFYRRSNADPNTLIVLGVWCGRFWCDVHGEHDPECLQTKMRLCHVVTLPFGQKPERYVNELFSPTCGLAFQGWGWNSESGECWAHRQRVTGGDRQCRNGHGQARTVQ